MGAAHKHASLSQRSFGPLRPGVVLGLKAECRGGAEKQRLENVSGLSGDLFTGVK